MFLSIVFAAAAGILIARKVKDRLLGVMGLAIGFSIMEAFFAPVLALTAIGLAVLVFFYVTWKTDWMVALAPRSREDGRSHSAVEVE